MMNKHLRFDLTGRIALITGSSKGIGLALACALASAGARVVLNARDADRLEATRAALAGQGIDVQAFAFDVTDADAVQAGVARIEAEVGPIDILVNNAGMQHRAPFTEFPLDAWHRITTTNLPYVPGVHLVTAANVGADGGDKNLFDPGNGYREQYRRIWGK